MNITNVCPCCSNAMLHHFGNHREYWFCRHCWSEMPNIEDVKESRHKRLSNIINLSTNLVSHNQLSLVN